MDTPQEQAERPDRCETCKFWEQTIDDCGKLLLRQNDLGYCKRFPPILDQSRTAVCIKGNAAKGSKGDIDSALNYPILWVQPITWISDWCGEWQAKPGAVGLPVVGLPVPAALWSHPACAEPLASNDGPETLPLRIVNALESEGILTWGELLSKSKIDVLCVRNVAQGSFATIVAVAKAKGLPIPSDWGRGR